MVNTEDFIKRIEIVLDYYGVNASTFADKIGVQRSSLSHLLSGRNKPSLDFILKILDVYPEIDLYWILNGKGSFPKNTSEPIHSEPITPQKNITPTATTPDEDLFSNTVRDEKSSITTNQSIDWDDTIEKIVFFYKDGTFKIFSPDPKK